MTRFTDIDLARLPPLPVSGNYEEIRVARLGELQARLAARGFEFDVTNLETDPLVITEEAGAYRELLLLARRDDAVRSVMLASSWGVYLDHLGATQVPGVARNPLVAAPRPFVGFPEDWEADDEFRRRIQLAPEALSTAGPEGGYLFYTLDVDEVKTASCYGPMSFGGTPANPFTPMGEVHIPIVAVGGNGLASPALVAAVEAECRASDRRPIADFVIASAADIVPYTINAVLRVGPGADPGAVKTAAEARAARQAQRQHRPGAAQLQQMLYGALYVPDSTGAIIVEEVRLISPAEDVNAVPITPATPHGAYRAPFCTGINISLEVVDV